MSSRRSLPVRRGPSLARDDRRPHPHRAARRLAALACCCSAATRRATWYARAPARRDAWRALAAERARADGLGASAGRCSRPRSRATGAAAARLARVRRRGRRRRHDRPAARAVRRPDLHVDEGAGALALADAIEARDGHPDGAGVLGRDRRRRLRRGGVTVVARRGGAERLRCSATPPDRARRWRSRRSATSARSSRAAATRRAAARADPRPLDAVRARVRRSGAHGRRRVRRAAARRCSSRSASPVLDASHPAVASAGRPRASRRARHRRDAVERALRRAAREFARAGFEPQVEDVPGSRSSSRARARASAALAVGRAASPSGRWRSRRTCCCARSSSTRSCRRWRTVAGPGELAYFAQVSAVADALDVAAPLAVPRWSCTLLEPHVRDACCDGSALQPDDLAMPHARRGRLARERDGQRDGRRPRRAARRRRARSTTALGARAAASSGLDAVGAGRDRDRCSTASIGSSDGCSPASSARETEHDARPRHGARRALSVRRPPGARAQPRSRSSRVTASTLLERDACGRGAHADAHRRPRVADARARRRRSA